MYVPVSMYWILLLIWCMVNDDMRKWISGLDIWNLQLPIVISILYFVIFMIFLQHCHSFSGHNSYDNMMHARILSSNIGKWCFCRIHPTAILGHTLHCLCLFGNPSYSMRLGVFSADLSQLKDVQTVLSKSSTSESIDPHSLHLRLFSFNRKHGFE